jgi:hypothetical protein
MGSLRYSNAQLEKAEENRLVGPQYTHFPRKRIEKIPQMLYQCPSRSLTGDTEAPNAVNSQPNPASRQVMLGRMSQRPFILGLYSPF